MIYEKEKHQLSYLSVAVRNSHMMTHEAYSTILLENSKVIIMIEYKKI